MKSERDDLTGNDRHKAEREKKMRLEERWEEVKREREKERVSHSRPLTDGWHLAPHYLRK